MAELFGRDRTVISRHANNCFKESELDKSLVCAKFAHTKKYGRHDGFELRTTAILQAHNSCCATAYQLLCASRY